MRFRALLIIVVLAVAGGCGFSVEVRVQGQAQSPPTTKTTSKPAVPTHQETATPDPSMPHHTVRFRLFVVDADHNAPYLANKPGPNLSHDAQTAKAVRQDPALADVANKAARERAADSIDCSQDDDPLLGQDDPSLPLAACQRENTVAVMQPVLFDASMIAGATYGPSIPPAQGYTVWVHLTPAGRDIVSAMAPKNINVPLAVLFDGRLMTWLLVPEKLTDTLAFDWGDASSAHDAATVLVNNR